MSTREKANKGKVINYVQEQWKKTKHIINLK